MRVLRVPLEPARRVLVAALVASCGWVAPAPASEEPPIYFGRAFIFEADVATGIEHGWMRASETEEALERIERALQDRLRRSGKFVEGVVRREAGSRFAVTFVGKQSRGFEEFVIGGLSAAGRWELRRRADEADLAACDSSLAEEAGRLRQFFRTDPSRQVSRFNHLGREQGGPCPTIEWLAVRRGSTLLSEAVAVEAGSGYLFHTGRFERLEVVNTTPGEPQLAASITLEPAALEELAEFVGGGEDPLVLAVDGVALQQQRITPPPANPVRLDTGLEIDEFRPLIFSLAGEPLPAPLVFVERAERELPNVKHRDSPTAID